MSGGVQREPELVVTPEGWVTTSLDYFRFLVDHTPPRPSLLLSQLRLDARSWKPLVMWAVGAGAVALGATGRWYFIPFGVFGVFLLATYLWLLLRLVRNYRWGPLLVGVIEVLDSHPLVRYCATARARLADGREVAVVLLARLAAEIIWERGRAEVLFLHDPKSQYSSVIGARPVSGSAERGPPVDQADSAGRVTSPSPCTWSLPAGTRSDPTSTG